MESGEIVAKVKCDFHPDFKVLANLHPPINKPMAFMAQKSLALLMKAERSTDKYSAEHMAIPVGNGATIPAVLYSPVGVGDDSPCLIYYPGGGFVFPGAPYHYTLAKEYAVKAKCKVLFAQYRLAPSHRFPVPIDDCYATYCWVLDNAQKLRINPQKIAVAGDSAGGMMTAMVSLCARKNGAPMPCGQMLVYPVTDQRGDTDSMRKYTHTPMCNSRDIQKYLNLCMPKNKEEFNLVSPMEEDDLSSLPMAYVETAEFDCLRDDGIGYAKRLEEAGNTVELYNTVGTMHGFDFITKSPIVQDCIDHRVAFLTKVF